MSASRRLPRWVIAAASIVAVCLGLALAATSAPPETADSAPVAALADVAAGGAPEGGSHAPPDVDYWPMLFVFVLSSFIGLGVIRRVSRLLHTPLMSLTNAISAIAVVGAILVTGPDYPVEIRMMGAVALFASVTNIVSGFLITDRMLKMFKQDDSR